MSFLDVNVADQIIAIILVRSKHWDILAFLDIELAYVPVQAITETAKMAKNLNVYCCSSR